MLTKQNNVQYDLFSYSISIVRNSFKPHQSNQTYAQQTNWGIASFDFLLILFQNTMPAKLFIVDAKLA